MNTHSIRTITASDIPAIKAIIDSTQMFPGELIDDMIKPYLSEPNSAEQWLGLDQSGLKALGQFLMQ